MLGYRNLIFVCYVFLASVLICGTYAFSEERHEKIVFAADYYCPINCEPKSKQKTNSKIQNEGYAVDILREIYGPENVIYLLQPWARALYAAKSGKLVQAVIGASKQEAPGFFFPNEPIYVTPTCLYALKNQVWSYKDHESLKSIKKLGVVRDYSYSVDVDLFIKEYPEKIDLTSGGDRLVIQRLIQKIESERVTAVISDKLPFEYVMKHFNMGKNIRAISCPASFDLKEDNGYVAFSPKFKNSKKLVHEYSEGIVRLRNSGKLKLILDKYGIEDWTK